MKPYQLVPDSLSKDVEPCLEELLEHARSGRLVGIAFAAMYKGKKYITNTAGEAYISPTFTRGMVAALDDEVRSYIGR